MRISSSASLQSGASGVRWLSDDWAKLKELFTDAQRKLTHRKGSADNPRRLAVNRRRRVRVFKGATLQLIGIVTASAPCRVVSLDDDGVRVCSSRSRGKMMRTAERSAHALLDWCPRASCALTRTSCLVAKCRIAQETLAIWVGLILNRFLIFLGFKSDPSRFGCCNTSLTGVSCER